jgi:hypothetical protein
LPQAAATNQETVGSHSRQSEAKAVLHYGAIAANGQVRIALAITRHI